MLTIRLQRVGKKKYPTYRFIISEKTRDSQAPYLELLGTYNPHDKENGLIIKEDRIKHWLTMGAQTSNTVYIILLKLGLVSGKKKKSITISNTRKKKLDEKKKATDEAKKVAVAKAKEAEEARKAEEAKKAEEAVVAEAPVEEKPAEEVKTVETPVEETKEEKPKE